MHPLISHSLATSTKPSGQINNKLSFQKKFPPQVEKHNIINQTRRITESTHHQTFPEQNTKPNRTTQQNSLHFQNSTHTDLFFEQIENPLLELQQDFSLSLEQAHGENARLKLKHQKITQAAGCKSKQEMVRNQLLQQLKKHKTAVEDDSTPLEINKMIPATSKK